MATEPATERLLKELRQTLEHMGIDLDRAEILTAALHNFARPIPDYEPRFQHFNNAALNLHQLGSDE